MKLLPLITLIFVCNLAFCQVPDNIYVEGNYMPGTNVTDVSKLKAGLSFPLFKNDKNSLSIGGSYQVTQYSYVDPDVPFTTDEIEDFHTVAASLKYARAFGNQWNFIVMGQGQLSAAYLNNTNSNSYFINGTLLFRKINTEKNSIWNFGATYNHQYGLDFPIPVISYFKQVSNAWSYKIGVPEMETNYRVGNSHTFSAFAKLDGFMGSYNEDMEIRVAGFDSTGLLKQTTVIAGLGYAVTMFKNTALFVKGGYTLYNNLSVQDNNNNEVYNFDIKNNFYLSAGIKIDLQNKLLD